MTPDVMLSMQTAAAIFATLGVAIVFFSGPLSTLLHALPGGLFTPEVTKPDELGGQFGAICGFFYVYIGCQYFFLAGSMEFARYSVLSRSLFVPGFLGVLVLLNKIPPQVLLFALIDVATALWTWFVLPARPVKPGKAWSGFAR